jgi:hypothetical protein
MLSLTKKSDEPVATPLWHVNFRNFERLPDTKVVRTTFFVNTAAIALTIGLLLWLGYREYHIYSLGDQIAQAQREIDGNTKANQEALRLSRIFADEEKKLIEAEAFTQKPIVLSNSIRLLGQTLPKQISIEYFEASIGDHKSPAFSLRGVAAGTRETASGAASSYVDTLRAHPRLGKILDPITLEKINPDPATGFMSFEISLKVKTEGKK